MKAESFFIGPHDEDKFVQMDMSLSDLKYLHGVLVENYNRAQKLGSVSQQLEDLMLNIHKTITHKLQTPQDQPQAP